MTPKQRLLAAIRFQGPDRVPVSPRMWRYMLRHDGSQSLDTYLRYVDTHGLTPLLTMNVHPLGFIRAGRAAGGAWGEGIRVEVRTEESAGMLTVYRTFETQAGTLSDRTRIPPPGGEFGIGPDPHVEEHLVKEHADLEVLRLLARAWGRRYDISGFRADAARVGDRGLLAIGCNSAVSDNAGWVYPLESMMVDSYEDPVFVNALIDVFHEPLLALYREGLEQGAEMVYCSTYYESMSAGWSPDLYRSFFLPRIRAQVELAHRYGAVYHHYDDGKVRATLPMLREIGVDLVSTLCPPPAGDIGLREARELAGDRMCLNGGVDTVNELWRGSPESIEAAVRDAIRDAASPAGGYILGTSDSITEETPPANFAAFFAAAEQYGKVD
jgi:hypothetical protein